MTDAAASAPSAISSAAGAACICCGGAESEPHLRGLRRCPRCTHVWADMRLSPAELRELYSANYFQGAEYLDYKMEARALRHNFRPRARELAAMSRAAARENQRPASRPRLWEIGCAYGFFLDAARDLFDAAGCDISEHAVRHARETLGLDARAGDYLEMPPPAEPFDAVCLWDTVEHLAEPHRYLRKAASELRPGGMLALSTGDIGSWMARRRGERWRLIHPPTHLHYFTARSITPLLEGPGMGLRVERIFHPAFWRSADAVAFRLLGFPADRWSAPLYRALKAAHLLSFAFPVNTGDLMTVYARRTGA